MGVEWAVNGIAIAIPIVLPFFHWCCFTSDTASMCRCYSMHFYMGQFVWATILILYGAGVLPNDDETCETLSVVASVYLPVSYCMVLLESCCSHEAGYLGDSFQEDNVDAYITSMIQTEPVIETHVECYHREKIRHNQKTKYVEVSTWTGSERYELPYWKDKSDVEATPTFSSTKVTRLELNETISFKDSASEIHYERAKEAFVDANRHRDELIRYYDRYDLPGLLKRSMVYGSSYEKPWWMDGCWYCMAVIFCMAWPYRILFNKKSAKAEFIFLKEISCEPGIWFTCGLSTTSAPATTTDPSSLLSTATTTPSAPPPPETTQVDRQICPAYMKKDLELDPPPPSYDDACGDGDVKIDASLMYH